MPTKQLKFNTAIITYPSSYDGLLTLNEIKNYYEEKWLTETTYFVIAQEDADDQIQRTHFHIYWDDKKQKSITTNYFDIPLKEKVVVMINKDKTRTYKTYNDLCSELGADSDQELCAKLGQTGKEFDILSAAHPNIEVKKQYGDKCFMLSYVMKQKLIGWQPKKETSAKYLDELKRNDETLILKVHQLVKDAVFYESESISCILEAKKLFEKYVKKINNQEKKRQNTLKRTKKGRDELLNMEMEMIAAIWELRDQNPFITRGDVMSLITKNPVYRNIFTHTYLNYSKFINEFFKNKPIAKPIINYNVTYWIPNKLYDYIMWLDRWIENWTTGKKDQLEHRPKGLCLIGASRTGKTSLMCSIGEFSYFKNIWNSDNWEILPPYTIMDDMDAQDEGKGLSFSWFKPWFGAQDSMTITDKYRTKEDIINGKPLIWINNYDIDETFKSETAQDYIKKNMIYVNLGHRNLFTPPTEMEIFKFKEFDPKTTWYYQNVLLKNKNTEKDVDVIEIEDDADELIPLIERKRSLLLEEVLVESENENEKENLNAHLTSNPNPISNETNPDLSNQSDVGGDEEQIKGRPNKRIRIEN